MRWLIWLSLLIASPIYAWNAIGHQLIAQIAYDNLTPVAKQMYQRLAHQGKQSSFVSASTWLDKIRARHDPYYDDMHYVDIPYSNDACTLPPLPVHNALSATAQSLRTLSSKGASNREKNEAIKILLHLVGDLHQPMHAITKVSLQEKLGDRGGNLVVLVHNPIAKNLHAYWDKGAGYLIIPNKARRSTLIKMAENLEKSYPCNEVSDLDPEHWANESHRLARTVAYKFPIDETYQRVAITLIKQRIALAGCRLAGVINQLTV